MSKKIIHVNRIHIAQNAKDGGHRPTLTVKTARSNLKGFKVSILGPSTLIDAEHNGRRPLSCGARVWVETDAPIIVDGRTYK